MVDANTDGSTIKIALISTDAAFRSALKDFVKARANGLDVGLEVSEAFTSIADPHVERLRRLEPEIVFIDVEDEPDLALRFAQFLLDSSLARSVIGAARSPSSEFLIAAMQAGISAFVPKPVTHESVEAALQTVSRKIGLRGGRGTAVEAKVLTVFGAKAGAGTTTLSTNLALEVHRLSQKRTLLIDLDLERGDTALQLGLKPRFTIVDLLGNLHRLDAGLLASYVTRHGSGLEVLPAPYEPVEYGRIAGEQIDRLFQALKPHYGYLVIDCPSSLSPISRTALRAASQIYLVTTGELPTLRSLSRCLPLLQELQGRAGGSPLRLLVNRYEPNQPVTLNEIEWAVNLKVFHTFRNDYGAVIGSINAGTPVVRNGSSKYAQDIRSLASEITGAPLPSSGSRWLRGLTAPFRRRSRVRSSAKSRAKS